MKKSKQPKREPIDLKPAAPTQNNLTQEELEKKARRYLDFGQEIEELYNKLMDAEMTRRYLAMTVPAAQRDEFMKLMRELTVQSWKQENREIQLDLETEIKKQQNA